MAGCDNLYGNRKEWKELHDFLSQHSPEGLYFMKEIPDHDDEDVRICYIAEIQKYLIENCPLEWVQERLNDNFDVQRFICGKAHHEEF